ncbi:MAG: choice-of-anchor B family protein [Bacteroidia bacterium]
MKKLTYLSVLILAFCINAAQAQNFNMLIRDSLSYSGQLANIGGIVIGGNEYALVGWEFGLSIVNVTNPDSVYEVVNVPGTQSEWREVKIWGNYAYVTTEAGGGLQIVDCSNLATSGTATATYYTGDGAIAGQIGNIHALHIADGYVYLYGSNLFNGAAVICDLNANPLNPVYQGHTPGNYVHDGYVRNDTLWAGEIYQGIFAIYDVSDKTNPVLINTQTTPGAFTHNTWLNDAGNVLFTTDEIANSYLTAYDVSDPNNITELDRIQTAPGSNSIVHNTHTLNDYEIVSWYTEGVVIVDAARPTNLVEVAKYDCSTSSGGVFEGAWGVYPYLPSGNLVVSDMFGGLYVITPTYQRGCYLEGIVTDSITGLAINNASVQIVTTPQTSSTDLSGNYKTGIATAGLYDITVGAFGYYAKTITGVSLSNGVVTQLNVQLASAPTFTLTGMVTDAANGNPIPNAKVHLQTGLNQFNITADPSGNFSINNFVPALYDYAAQQWGYRTACSTNVSIQPGNTLTIPLTQGIYDDFVFDWGWTVTGTAATGMFEKGEPLGTSVQGVEVNPDNDDQSDCGDECYITGNTGVQFFDDAVLDGYTQLESPVFDATNIINPRVKYVRWFFNYADPSSGLIANDTLIVSINNGTQTAILESYHPGNTLASWVNKSYLISTYIPLTNTMKLIFYTANQPGGQDILEVGIDKFEVVAGPSGIDELNVNAVRIFPNPANDYITINSQKALNTIQVCDVTGRIVLQKSQIENEAKVSIANLESGTYIVTVNLKDGSRLQQKLIVQR